MLVIFENGKMNMKPDPDVVQIQKYEFRLYINCSRDALCTHTRC